MSEENKVSNEAVVDSGTENVTQDLAQNEFIAESKKYRQRAQKAETKLDKLQRQMDVDRQKQMEENDQWRELAEERGKQIAELEPIVERAKADDASMREELLSDFSEEDREDFKELPTPALRKVHGKILKPKPVKTETSVAGFSNKTFLLFLIDSIIHS